MRQVPGAAAGLRPRRLRWHCCSGGDTGGGGGGCGDADGGHPRAPPHWDYRRLPLCRRRWRRLFLLALLDNINSQFTWTLLCLLLLLVVVADVA